MTTEPEILAARALLATCHHLMTGREIAICEDLDQNAEQWSREEWGWFNESDRHDLTLLITQFSREITSHLNAA